MLEEKCTIVCQGKRITLCVTIKKDTLAAEDDNIICEGTKMKIPYSF